MKKNRRYDNNYPSVTELLSIMFPFDNEGWAKGLFYANKERFVKYFDPFKATEEISQRAKDIGHRVHANIEKALVRNLDISCENANEEVMLNLFRDTLDTNELGGGEVERVLKSEKMQFNGTSDYIQGDTIYDWKTSKIPKVKRYLHQKILSYKLQITFYAMAYEEETDKKISHGHIVIVTKENPPQKLEERFKITSELRTIANMIRKLYKEKYRK